MSAQRITASDLDLTDAIDQAARKLLGDVDHQVMSPQHRMNFKQRVLETVLPVLPSVIDQVEKLTREQVAADIRGAKNEAQAPWTPRNNALEDAAVIARNGRRP